MGIDYNQMDGGYDKYVVDAEATIPNKMSDPKPMRVVGEDKFEKDGFGESIYADDTRNDVGVADDKDNYEPMTVARDDGEGENQGTVGA
jgi:hypothetical protein